MRGIPKARSPYWWLSWIGLFWTGLLLLFLGTAQALQPLPADEIERLKAEGSYETWVESAKQLGNHRLAPQLVEKFKAKKRILKRKYLESQGLATREALGPLSSGSAQPGLHRTLQSTGSPKTFVLLIEFNNYPHEVGSFDLADMVYGDGKPANYPRESLANYYKRSSYDLLDLSDGQLFGWYTIPSDRSTIAQTTEGRENLIKEVLNHFNNTSTGHDFSQYDNDGDGYIDYFIVFWSGPSEARPPNGPVPFWWRYQTTWQDSSYTLDGKKLNRYSWQDEPENGAAVVIHETGHALGLPDYYDYDDTVGPDGGLGGFDMMDVYGGDHNCFSKWLLDWVEPIVVGGGMQAHALDISLPIWNCALIWPGIDLDDKFDEFFLVENRQAVLNDTSLGFAPDGLAIWHVDATLTPDGSQFAYDNSFTAHKMIRLMEADGLEELEDESIECSILGTCSNRPEASCSVKQQCTAVTNEDLYRWGDAFGPDTVPSSARYDGTPSCVRVWDIQDFYDTPGSFISARFSTDCTCSEPEPPLLSAPADGATDVPLTPNLAWNSVAGGITYQIRVCEDEACTIVVRSTTDTVSPWNVYPILDQGRRYWWQIRANNDCGASAWSGAWKFATVCNAAASSAPQLISPPDGTIGLGMPPTLQWQEVAGATDYVVEVCGDSQCWWNVVATATVGSNSWTVDIISMARQFWWRVRTTDSCRWSATWSFSRLESPNLLSPSDGAQNVSLLPTFDWSDVPAATSYEVGLCDSMMCRPECTISVTASTVTFAPDLCSPPYALSEGTTYYWYVVAKNSSDIAHSNCHSFQTCTAPTIPQLSSPLSGAVDVSTWPRLEWEETAGASSYDAELCSDASCSNVLDSKDTSVEHWYPGLLEEDSTYYWRVRSNNVCGQSSWSAIWSFSTPACQLPAPPSVAGPADGAVTSSTTPNLSWEAIQFATSYHVWVCSDSSCSDVVTSRTVSSQPPQLTYSWQVSPELAGNTQYWWQVASWNHCKVKVWNQVRSFTTCATPDAPLVADPGSSWNNGETYTLSWTAVAGATGYTVEEAADPSFEGAASTTVTGTSKTFRHILYGCSSETFYYRVKANNSCGGSAWSNTVDMVVNGVQPGEDCNTGMPGFCSAGTEQCRDGVLVCVPDHATQTEICDGLDNNCDGLIDEGNPGSGRSCDTGLPGVCSAGRTQCRQGTLVCIKSVLPSAEICDGLDNDCNGFIDERNPGGGKLCDTGRPGVCSEGRTRCQEGALVCVQDRLPKAEICDGLDNDCNGMVDDGDFAPAAPTLNTPTDGAVAQSVTPRLDWRDVPGAKGYLVEVCRDRICSEVVAWGKVRASEWVVSPALNEGTFYGWRVRAYNDCDTSPWSALWGFTTFLFKAKYEEGDPLISYTGIWHDVLCPSCSEQAFRYSEDSLRGSAEFVFYGKGIQWIAAMGPTLGIARVYLDGKYAGSVDLYKPSWKWRQTVFSERMIGLGRGTHTMRIEVSGLKNKKSDGIGISLDALRVIR